MKLPTNYRAYSRYYRNIGPFLEKPRIRAYTMLILSFFTMSFFGIFAIKPTLTTIAQLRKQIADSQLFNEKLERKIITLSQLKEEHKKIENDLPLLSKALPSEPKFYSFLQDLERFAQETGTTISSVRLESIDLTKKDTKSPTKIAASLTLEGNYSASQEFLNRLLNANRIYTLDRFGIHSNPKSGENITNLDLSVNSYYL